jgi:hypothetical protein
MRVFIKRCQGPDEYIEDYTAQRRKQESHCKPEIFITIEVTVFLFFQSFVKKIAAISGNHYIQKHFSICVVVPEAFKKNQIHDGQDKIKEYPFFHIPLYLLKGISLTQNPDRKTAGVEQQYIKYPIVIVASHDVSNKPARDLSQQDEKEKRFKPDP